MSEIDQRALRSGFGEFMTGITIITTLDADRQPKGLTANSFSSLSLDPPLLMFALGKESSTFDAFMAGNGFVVHVLGGDQLDLSARFAAKGIAKFDGIDWAPGFDDLPVIRGALATFECRQEVVHEGGDHLIMVGSVERFTVGERDRDALGYFRGRYISQS